MTDIAALRAYLRGKHGMVEDFPFGPDPLVLKIGGKMFALVSLNSRPATISLKCDPLHGQMLRDEFAAIGPGYHLDKRHWITVTLDGTLPDAMVRDLIDESYALVYKGLTRAVRTYLER
ncbi:MAG TPA: MmcQ/YjbR family DNA-binding protein [Roseiflexaceae bacterium]|nr:MmcQ/YjbR family DNA-binding protein [Roseiflexaceae bacterium]HMP42517.1 MmcQ/YjbR family DNA-binding protein [Roseiflexaceae bacterium]